MGKADEKSSDGKVSEATKSMITGSPKTNDDGKVSDNLRNTLLNNPTKNNPTNTPVDSPKSSSDAMVSADLKNKLLNDSVNAPSVSISNTSNVDLNNKDNNWNNYLNNYYNDNKYLNDNNIANYINMNNPSNNTNYDKPINGNSIDKYNVASSSKPSQDVPMKNAVNPSNEQGKIKFSDAVHILRDKKGNYNDEQREAALNSVARSFGSKKLNSNDIKRKLEDFNKLEQLLCYYGYKVKSNTATDEDKAMYGRLLEQFGRYNGEDYTISDFFADEAYNYVHSEENEEKHGKGR